MLNACLQKWMFATYAATGCNCDLNGVPARNGNFLQIQRLVLLTAVVAAVDVVAFDGQRVGVDADLNRGRPISAHHSLFVVETFELQKNYSISMTLQKNIFSIFVAFIFSRRKGKGKEAFS